MIKLTDIKKTYSNGVTAVKDLDITIESGKIIGFLGPNGAGKTTTLKIITGIIKPDTGTINVNGYRMDTQDIQAKMEMGFVSDDADVFLRLRGIEYLNFMADIYGVSQEERASRIKDMSVRLEMDKALKDKILGYSHGMRQKIVIMGALIHNPNVWILDEPLTGLDPKSSFVLKQMMREHADSGNTVFFSTHVLEVAEKICDEVFIINNGQIQFHGNMDSLRAVQQNDDSLENLFLEMTRDE